MIAGATWGWWIGFHVAVIILLTVDALLPASRSKEPRKQSVALLWTAVLVAASAALAVWLSVVQGRQRALEFVAGYAIETSLSVDNLFVFLVIFQGFRISPYRQHTALLWGVGGALILRAIFIAAGITLIAHFEWITWIFGAVLLYAAFRLVRGGSAKAAVPDWIRKLQPARGSLLPVIFAVEITDLLFAVDSIPAVLAVSRDPFVVYTSNIAAILGLRSLYFALASLLDRLRYLHYGLGAMLAFIAFKMLAAHWLDISIIISLAIMGAILTVCAVWSVMARPKPEHSDGSQEL